MRNLLFANVVLSQQHREQIWGFLQSFDTVYNTEFSIKIKNNSCLEKKRQKGFQALTAVFCCRNSP